MSDDTDYGQLLANSNLAADLQQQQHNGHNNNNNNNHLHHHHVPPLPQTDFQMDNAHTTSGSLQQAADNYLEAELGGQNSGQQRRSASQSKPTNGGQRQTGRGSRVGPRGAQVGAKQQQQQGSRHLLQGEQPTDSSGALSTTSPATGVQDSYEALGTEPTPSQLGSANARQILQQSRRNSSSSSSNNNNNSGRQQSDDSENFGPGDNRLLLGSLSSTTRIAGDGSTTELSEDIHTTRSVPLAGVEPPVVAPHLSQHSPYGLVLPTIVQQNRSKFSGAEQQLQQQGGELDEPLMTSYTRQPRANLSSDLVSGELLADELAASQLAELQAAAAVGQQQLGSASGHRSMRGQGGANSSSSSSSSNHHHHHHSLPFSMLLGDLIKLARPSSLLGGGGGGGGLEKPANSNNKPTYGSALLQQLRSLPGPVLALLQGQPLGAAQDSQAGQSHEVSESSQHYQQIPLASSALALRSPEASNSLPAFPPPKGTPAVWYPPTQGGNPALHDAMNSNADFVAGNSAGFLRVQPAAGQPASGPATASPAPPSAPPSSAQPPVQGRQSEQQQQQQPAKYDELPSYQRQSYESQPVVVQSLPANSQQQVAMGNQMFQQMMMLNGGNLASRPLISGPQQMVVAPSSQWPPVISSETGSVQKAPLGYQPQQRQQQLSAPLRSQFDQFAALSSESAPKASLSSLGLGAQKQHASKQAGALSNIVQAMPIQLNTIKRRQRRSVRGSSAKRPLAELEEDEAEEELLDSQPVSVVLPDGRPAEAEAEEERKEQLASSKRRRLASQKLDNSALQHYVAQEAAIERQFRKQHLARQRNLLGRAKAVGINGQKEAKKRRKSKSQKAGGGLEAAGSGLMSKLLLGVASTNDELEDEFDKEDNEGDEEEAGQARERRKEELEDTEFGVERPNNLRAAGESPPSEADHSGELNRLVEQRQRHADRGGGPGSPSSHLSAGSSGNGAYARRSQQQQQQQRADVEFYGHPGEETRQLKYGILGSGNYEVVNGGIYPEADESTAAVNSVANYVRKPSLLLSKLDGHSAAPIFMPGARLSIGSGGGGSGFVRGASAHPNALDLGPSPKSLANPLLELLAANGGAQHLFDPSLLLGQLGSSGSSAKTSFLSKETEDESNELGSSAPTTRGHLLAKPDKLKRTKRPKQPRPSSSQQLDAEEPMASQGSSSEGGTARANKLHGTNQFYSYQILPSKKVTIFSDQDLDSAPSDQHLAHFSARVARPN